MKRINYLLNSALLTLSLLFLSTSVYNISKVKSSMAFANFFQTSYAPHLVMLFMSLGDEGKCSYSSEQIVINGAEDTPEHLRWDMIFVYQYCFCLLDLLTTDK